MQSRDAIRAIKERLNITDIVRRYVDLKRNGPRWVAPCPFHQETKPSFSVNEEQGLFYCFGCQASGDIFDFYGRINGLDFRETLEQLAAEAGITLDRGPVDKKRQEEDRQRRSSRQTMLRMYELAAAHFAAADQKDAHICSPPVDAALTPAAEPAEAARPEPGDRGAFRSGLGAA